MDKPTVFISYSHKDEEWKNRLLPQLKALEQADRITVWDDRKIDGGDQWYPEIKEAMERAAVAVCLISSDYLASHFCVKEEIPYLLERCEKDGLVFIPLLLRPCTWKAFQWLKDRQMLPRDGKTVAIDFKDAWETVFAEVANQIFEIADDLPVKSFTLPHPPASLWPLLEKESVEISRLPITGSDLFGRQEELNLLDETLASASTNVISFVAWGGVGKSTLVNKWLERLAKDNYRGARRVYAWSFYSQGTSERATSADLFINSALIWFGDKDPTAGSPWDKGERLANLVRREKTLLLLDGMEPLQSSLAYERGKIKDPALATLVTELARENPGLCIITTRERIAELDDSDDGAHQISTGSVSDRVLPAASNAADQLATARRTVPARQLNLELLSPEAGRALLRVGGVRGTDEELEKATEDFGRHALALNLLAVYLQDIPGHHISEAAKIPDLDLPAEEGKHPRRLIAAFEQKFGEGPEVNVLRLLGLFDRPADGASITALRKEPVIPGLTNYIKASAKVKWLTALQRLRKYKLIAEESRHAPDELDAHPLVREHFGQQLRERLPDAWQAANNRLYEHLTRAAKALPETVEEMAPLFAAVAHGCAAGRHQEAYDDVYQRRIRRGNEAFSIKKLGTFGADLTILTGFFAAPWHEPQAGLTEADQGFILNAAGFCLRALGQLKEAAQPFNAGLEISISQKRWDDASTAAANLSELYLTGGAVTQALAFAQKSIDLGNKGANSITRIEHRAMLACALHQAGHLNKANETFRKAEVKLKKQYHPNFLLYSLSGFQYCDLLLQQGKYREVQKRAAQTLNWQKQTGILLDIALHNLSMGRAWLLRAQREGDSTITKAAEFLERAFDGLRQAGRQDYLPHGLLARAELRRVRGEYERARTDLNEAQRIAERGEMGLHLCDCHLEWARLNLAQGNPTLAREHWEKAKAMIERMGYHRRDKDVEEITQQLAGLETPPQTESSV